MEIRFIKGSEHHFQECAVIFKDTELIQCYAKDEDDSQLLKEWLLPHLTDGSTLLAVLNKRIAGVLMYDLDGMFGSFPYISMLGVEQNLRGQGIGTARLHEFFNICQGKNKDRCFLCVSSFNNRAESLYKNLGFEEVAIIHDFLKPGIDEHLLMIKIGR